jgi:hypothetical protein
MKTTTNTFAVIGKVVLLLLLVIFQSCGTYNYKTTEIETDLYNGNFKKAVSSIEKNKFLKKDRNRLLYLLEKGKTEHLLGNYEESNKLLEQAYIMIDDRIKTKAGQAVAAKLTNPMATTYKGEDFEKVTIHYYKALNYFLLGQPNEALVEAKRINIKLYELNEKYKENKNRYSEDAFSHILQGIIYESVGDINNAFIAYRNAKEIYSKNKGEYFGVAIPQQLKKDVLRTAWAMGFKEEYNAYEKEFGMTIPEGNRPQGEAIIFWENGMGPAKDQIVITASGGGGIFYGSYMDGDILQEIIIPIPFGTNIGNVNAIAIPKYRQRESYYSSAELVNDSYSENFELVQDFYPIARQCLRDRMLRETVEIVTRFAAKKAASAGLGALGKELLGNDAGELIKFAADAAGALTEKADTRNWQTLPATISYARVPLKEGINKFIIKKHGPKGVVDTDTIAIPFKRGLQILNYFDLGRTQLAPQENPKELPGKLNSPGKAPVVDKKIADKYGQWIEAGNRVSYKMEYAVKQWPEHVMYEKKITLKADGDKPVKVTYAVTELPFSDKLKEVKQADYITIPEDGQPSKEYFKISDTLKPGEETSMLIYQATPDYYITFFKAQ